MKENLKKFLEEASKNEDLKAKLAVITDRDTAVAKAIELAKEYGITLTAEDFKPDEGDKLSLDEMDQVAGGRCEIIAGNDDSPVRSCHCTTNGFGF